jgi:hypothetical protein
MKNEVENKDIKNENQTKEAEVKNTSTEQTTQLKQGFFRSLIDGEMITKQILVKQLPFVFYVTFLCALYIANRYSSEKIVRETHELLDELKDLRAEHISITSDLMQLSQQSEVLKLITEKQLQLTESIEPPKIIITKDDK